MFTSVAAARHGRRATAAPGQRETRPQSLCTPPPRNRRSTKMAPLTWRVALTDLRKGFKVKSSSPSFTKGKHEFCLDVYRDGWGDEDREFVAVFVRYVSRRGTCKGVAAVALEGGPRWQAPEEVLFAPVADLEKRSRSGDRRFMSREAFLALATQGPLVFTASIEPARRLSQRERSVAKEIEDMSEDDVREALLAVDRGVPWPIWDHTPSTRRASIRRGREWSHFRF